MPMTALYYANRAHLHAFNDVCTDIERSLRQHHMHEGAANLVAELLLAAACVREGDSQRSPDGRKDNLLLCM